MKINLFFCVINIFLGFINLLSTEAGVNISLLQGYQHFGYMFID